jgi:hypothetical protein
MIEPSDLSAFSLHPDSDGPVLRASVDDAIRREAVRLMENVRAKSNEAMLRVQLREDRRIVDANRLRRS